MRTGKNDQSIGRRKLLFWFLLIIISGIAIRILLYTTYTPVSYNDTPSYWRSAGAIVNGFKNYDGTRTPGYPALLALLGSERVVYGVQLFMGFSVTLIIFYLGWKLSQEPAFGALAAFGHSLNAGQVFFEANILTETMTTFWIFLTFLLIFEWMKKPENQRNYLLVFSGVTSSLATLTRPLFIFFPILLGVCFSVSFTKRKIAFNWRSLVCVILPAIILVGGWMSWVKSRFGVFNLSTMGGYHLVQHTGNYFEDVPQADAIIRDVYLYFRDERIASYGTQGNTIWDAIPALQQASGLSFYDLSRELQRISIDLIKTHPDLYLKYAAKGWWLFWRAPVYWSDKALAFPNLTPLINGWVIVTRVILFGSNLLFIITSVLALVWRKLRKIWHLKTFLWLMAGTIWMTSVLQTFLDHGDNPRFLVPIQSLCVFWTLWIGYYSLLALMKNRKKGKTVCL